MIIKKITFYLVISSACFSECNQIDSMSIEALIASASNAKLIETNSESERSGCCSWHQGVCGCSFGNITCCDGTYSPTC